MPRLHQRTLRTQTHDAAVRRGSIYGKSLGGFFNKTPDSEGAVSLYTGTLPLDPPLKQDEKKCWFCSRDSFHRGFCDPCYREILRGEVVPVEVTVAAYTRFVFPPDGLNGPIEQVRVPAHKRIVRKRAGGSGFEPWRPSQEDKGPCSTTACKGRAKWTGLCRPCYYRARRRGPDADLSVDGRAARHLKKTSPGG